MLLFAANVEDAGIALLLLFLRECCRGQSFAYKEAYARPRSHLYLHRCMPFSPFKLPPHSPFISNPFTSKIAKKSDEKGRSPLDHNNQ